MSIEAMLWALNLAPIPMDDGGRSPKPSSACAFVLLGLANHAQPDGSDAFPSVRTLCRYTRLSERTVRTCLDRLEGASVIRPNDPALVAVKIKRGDRRPKGWNLAMDAMREDLSEEDLLAIADANPFLRPWIAQHLARGATAAPRDDERGATGAERGATDAERGAATAPEPSLDPSLNRPEESSSSETPGQEVPRPDVEALCTLLADLIEANGSKRPTITRTWRREARLMLDRDGRDFGKAKALIQWCQADRFWKTNILSMPKFREQYDQLRLKALEQWESGSGRQQRGGTDDRVRGWLDPALIGRQDDGPAAIGGAR